MPLPNIEDFDEILDRTVADVLGDTIRYAADGAVFEDLKAHVDYRDRSKPFQGVEAMEQDILVAIVKADVAAMPTGSVRITLPKLAGRSFKPVNIGSDQSGTHWTFELKDVTSG